MLHRTTDEAGQFFTTEKIGTTRELTPEGFLLCRNVPIARTGELLYGEGEVPVEPGKDGIIRINRGEDVLFDPKTIASFEGKDIVDDHPDEDVTPATWKDVTVGSVHNVRKGEGEFADCLVADLLIKDPDAISAVEEGKVEISCGYDAEYTQDEAGKGRQTQIIGNHVALVDNGRCGSRCSIGDSAMKKRVKFKDRIKAMFKARDAEGLEQVLDEMEDEGGADTHVHVHLSPGSEGQAGAASAKDEGEIEQQAADPMAALSARLDKIEQVLAKLIPQEKAEGHQLDEANEELTEDEEEDDDKSKTDDEEGEEKTKDSANADVLARIEVLNPGQKVGKTTDAKKAKATIDSAKRKALDAAMEKHGDLVKPFLMGHTTDKLSGATLDAAFIGASELIKQQNNAKVVITSVHTKDAARPAGVSNGDLNKKFDDFWNRK